MQTEIDTTALAQRLGITRDVWPEWFKRVWPEEPSQNKSIVVCTIPSPLSDDPRACVWEPFLMRALGWPSMCAYTSLDLVTEYKVNDRMGATWCKTPTAALYSAFAAREDGK